MIGQTLGHYRIVEKIGAGGMGVVYRAHDERLDRDVALKVLPAGTLADEAARRRFRREALALAKLNHPNIGAVYDFDTQDGMDFLVMEHIAGGTLANRLAGGALPEKEVAALGMQIAAALEEAHERGIVHRDLKPGNIAVTPKGQVKVLDFGLAKLLQPAPRGMPGESLTESVTEAQAVGTLPYMAPEQVQGERVDARTDIHALGLVLYEMASGRRPFQADSPLRLSDAIRHQPPVSPRAVNAVLSPELERIILKCLEKDPESRYQSAKELGVDLRRLAAPATGGAVPAATPPRWRWMVLASGALVLAALLVASWLYFNAGPSKAIDSIAVLPFANTSGDPNAEYLSDGVTESIINSLSQLPKLRVVPRGTVFRYKSSAADPEKIGRDLKVRAILTGKVALRGETLVIQSELTDVAAQSQLWGQQYNRKLSDLLTVQEEISREITDKLRLRLTGEEQKRITKRYTENVEAYQLYLKCRYYWDKSTEEDLNKSERYCEQAIQKDPNYAPAYYGLADDYAFLGWIGRSPQEAYPKAKAALLKALEIDDTLAETHYLLGVIDLYFDYDPSAAEREFSRSLVLNPSSPNAHYGYGCYLVAVGRLSEALAEMKRAVELDPLSLTWNEQLGGVYVGLRQYDQALAQWQKALEIDPSYWVAHRDLGVVYAYQGKQEQAITEFQKAVTYSGGNAYSVGYLGYGYAMAGRKGKAQEKLAELKEQLRHKFIPSLSIAVIYAGLGDTDRAFEWLEKAYREREGWLAWYFILDPEFERLRPDPRYEDLMRRLRLPVWKP